MNNFIFENKTKIYFGEGQLKHLSNEVVKFGHRVLLVYGQNSVKSNGLFEKTVAELSRAEITLYEFSGIEPNPHHSTVDKGAALCREKRIDLIIALGGGSTIDAAKAIAITAKYDGCHCWDLVMRKVTVSESIPVIAIPTLVGTGSEMNGSFVISNTDSKEKIGYTNSCCQPVASFLDPMFTYTVNAYQTACGCVDTMSHVFERAYLSLQEEMDMLLCMQEDLFATVVKYGPKALHVPDDYEARANLMWASTLAQNGFLYGGVSQVGACHRMEHELSALYDITHGLGIAILTPRFLTYVLNEKTALRIKRFGEKVFGVDPKLSDHQGAEESIKCLESFFNETLLLPHRLSDLGIGDEKFALMSKRACAPSGTIHGFIDLEPDDVFKIYEMCL